MTSSVRAIAASALMCLLAAPSIANAQGRPLGGRAMQEDAPPPAADSGVSPVEIQRLFDAYIVMQAQQELQLTDDQFPPFLARVRALQDVRRRGQTERARILQELRRLSLATTVDEEQIRVRIKSLADLDIRVGSAVKQALDGVDQVLNLRQQARFRLFEEQMERRKVELLMRARQTNRPRQQF